MVMISYLQHVVLKGVQFAYELKRGDTTPEDYQNIRIKTEIMKIGLEIIPNKLWIRQFTQEDVERFSNHLKSSIYIPPTPSEKQLVIEYAYSDTSDWIYASPGDLAILALRLIRKGRIMIDYYYTIEKESDQITMIPHYIFGVSPYYVTQSFDIYTSDVSEIRELFTKLMKYEWKHSDPIRLALNWFSRACNEQNLEDKIIELCIGYEAFYHEGKGRKGSIRNHLAKECSNYLAEIYNGEQISDIINHAYQVRNDLMHGGLPRHYTKEQVGQFEEYLRCSLRKKILNGKSDMGKSDE